MGFLPRVSNAVSQLLISRSVEFSCYERNMSAEVLTCQVEILDGSTVSIEVNVSGPG